MGRKLIAAVLLLFVVVALTTLALCGRATTDVQPVPPVPSTVAVPAARPALVAFYFHGNKRCVACGAMERLTRAALQDEVARGGIEVRAVNVDDPAHAHFIEDFQLTMRTVVIAQEDGGKVARWKRLDECWDIYDDPPAFTAYIQQSFAAFRALPPSTP